MNQIYKAYDIRGIYPSEINEEIIYKIGRAWVEVLKSIEKKDDIKLLIITDNKFKNILEKEKDFIKERTNSKKLEILENVTTDKERFKINIEFKIKDKRGEIVIITTH